MQNILVDSGPLIALFDSSDVHHKKVLKFLASFEGELVTSWPVITEVSHMLDFHLKAQLDFLYWIECGGMKVYELSQHDIAPMRSMMEKYSDLPMDLADASLMYIANKENFITIASIDSDFDIYRTLKKQNLINVLH